MEQNKIDIAFFSLSVLLIGLLLFVGYLSYKSIDFKILQKLESQKLVLPQSNPTPIASPSSTSIKK